MTGRAVPSVPTTRRDSRSSASVSAVSVSPGARARPVRVKRVSPDRRVTASQGPSETFVTWALTGASSAVPGA